MSRLFSLALMSVLAAGLVCAGGVYFVDDGSSEETIGLNGDDFTLVWMNGFVARPGMTHVDRIGIAWAAVGVTSGYPVTLAIWNDPNQDGNPTDAVLQRSLNIGIGDLGNVFDWYDITPLTLAVGDHFFVGAVWSGKGGTFPAALDQTSSARVSWAGAWQGADVVDYATLTGFNEYPLRLIDDYGFPGNFMVRASDAVPEPVSFGLCGLGLLALGWWARKRAGA